MANPLVASVWGIITVIVVLLIMSLVVLAAIVTYGRKIRESEKRFYHLFNKVFDVLILIDKKGLIVDVNEAACSLLGYSKRELAKSHIEEYMPDNEWRRLRVEFDRVLKSGLDFIGETELICKGNNRLIRVEVGGTRTKFGDSMYVLGSFRDITERWRAEESLKRKNIALSEILENLEERELKIKKGVADTVDQILLPALDRILREDGKINKTYYDSLKTNLQELSASTGGILHVYSKLTQREIEICNLIKSGATTKEIARTFNVSEKTIHKHRGNIRSKLNIANKEINLLSFLKNLE
jgi:PAS domain S-box-containing protein